MTTTRSRTKRCEDSRSDASARHIGRCLFGSQKEVLRSVLGVRFTADDLRRMADEPTVIEHPLFPLTFSNLSGGLRTGSSCCSCCRTTGDSKQERIWYGFRLEVAGT